MREIKFRVWDKENNQWFKPTYMAYKGELEDIHINLDGSTILRHLNSIQHESTFPDRFIKVQYTGLKDKNGKEIYEGDIIKTGDGNIGVVEYHSYNVCGFSIIASEDYYSIGYTFHGKMNQEIIGNIYENPELGVK